MTDTNGQVSPKAAEPLGVHRDGFEEGPMPEVIRCLTYAVVYMELDGRVVCTTEGHHFSQLRPADDGDLAVMLGRAKVEVDARIAYAVFNEQAEAAIAAQQAQP